MPARNSLLNHPARHRVEDEHNALLSSPVDLHSPLDFPDIPPLPFINLCRGLARFCVAPYSAEHAHLTGHTGSPTRSKGQHIPRAPLALANSDNTDIESESEEEDILTPKVRLFSRLWFPTTGDREELKGMQALRIRRAIDPSAVQPTSSPQDYETTSEDDALGSDLGSVELNGRDDSHLDPANGGEESDDEPDLEHHVALPIERSHSKAKFMRSPYLLRNRNRASVVERIRSQVRVVGLPFDAYFSRKAGIQRFDPRTFKPSRTDDLDLLFRCTTFTAVGITIIEFGKIMRLCDQCDRYVFVESLKKHSCRRKAYDPKAKNFSITLAVYCYNCPGIDFDDLEAIFLVCDTCRRVYLKKFSDMHSCSGPSESSNDSE